MKPTLPAFLMAALLILGQSAPNQSAAAEMAPEITITDPAPRGPGGSDRMDVIAGTTKNAPPDAIVIVYAYAGGVFWVQPLASQNATSIAKDGRWSTPTHLGDIYVALLTKKSWKAPPKLGSLPPVGGDILAVHQIGGR